MLDECDEMLNMGFVDDVEKILSAGGSTDVQTLLFSATLPSWVKDITRRFLKPTHRTIDLVGNQKMKVSLRSAACSQSTEHSLSQTSPAHCLSLISHWRAWRWCSQVLICGSILPAHASVMPVMRLQRAGVTCQ